MKAMILGSHGYIGKNLIESIRNDKRFSEVVGINRKSGITAKPTLTNNSNYEEFYCRLDSEPDTAFLFKNYQPDIIFHLAGNSRTNAKSYLDDILITHNIVSSAPEGTRLILASSVKAGGEYSLEGSEHVSGNPRSP